MKTGRKVLVLGASGFIGSHAAESLRQAGHQVIGSSSSGEGVDLACDLLDPASAEAAAKAAAADVVLIAAGMSSVKEAWRDPHACFELNTGGVFNLLEALRRQDSGARLILLSSAAVYGPPASSGGLPFTEATSPDPASPYAASKLAAELLCRQYGRQYGIEVLVLRLFNQIGPGQGPEQAPSEFARMVAEAEKSRKHLVALPVGNPAAKRDYMDVRDSSRLVAEAIGMGLTGNYNVCSGQVLDLAEVVKGLALATEIEVRIEPQADRAHPADVNEVSGSGKKLFEATGWQPVIPIGQSLAELLDSWRSRV